MTMQVPRKILVVDDDPASRLLVTETLADVGFVCISADSGGEALRVLEEDRDIAVLVSDIVMPGLDGIRLGQFIRARFPDRPWLQVIFITGQAALELAVSALRLGATDYLTKPVAPEDLVFAVSRALAASRAVVGAAPPVVPAVPHGPNGQARAAADTPETAARSTLDYLAALRRIRQDSPMLAGLDEPSWTILLEAYRADIAGRRLSVSKLCALDETSQTTAWRRIRSMEDAGLLLRDQDPADARRSFVALTDAAGSAVADFMSRADALIVSQAGA